MGGETAYEQIGSAATSFGSPGDEYFDAVFKGRKVLVMLDELAAYAARVEAARPGGRASVATFLMSLFQYAKDHTGLAVVLTLASQRDAFARQTTIARHMDLRDPRLSDELISRTERGDPLPIITADIGSAGISAQDSNAALADRANPHPGGFPHYEYVWKTIFLHSLAGFGEGLASNVFGINKQDALFATAFPDVTPPQVETALDAIRSQAYYLRYSETEGRYYASTGVSINRVL